MSRWRIKLQEAVSGKMTAGLDLLCDGQPAVFLSNQGRFSVKVDGRKVVHLAVAEAGVTYCCSVMEVGE